MRRDTLTSIPENASIVDFYPLGSAGDIDHTVESGGDDDKRKWGKGELSE